MKKQVVIVRGGNSYESRENFLDALRAVELNLSYTDEAEKRWNRNLPQLLGDEYEVFNPTMPCKDNAHFMEWEIWFSKYIPFLRDGVHLIGHSLGANFLATYLSEHTVPIRIDSLHLVAGCAGVTSFAFPSNGANIERQAEKIYLYHSKSDPVVAFSDMEKYADILPTAEKVVFEDRGHFLGEEFPELMERIKG